MGEIYAGALGDLALLVPSVDALTTVGKHIC